MKKRMKTLGSKSKSKIENENQNQNRGTEKFPEKEGLMEIMKAFDESNYVIIKYVAHCTEIVEMCDLKFSGVVVIEEPYFMNEDLEKVNELIFATVKAEVEKDNYYCGEYFVGKNIWLNDVDCIYKNDNTKETYKWHLEL